MLAVLARIPTERRDNGSLHTQHAASAHIQLEKLDTIMSNSILSINPDLVDYLGGNADDAHTEEAIENLTHYAPDARLDPIAASLTWGSKRFRIAHRRGAGLVIPVETAGVIRAADGSAQIAVRCNVPNRIRVNGKMVSRVIVPIGDLEASTAARHTHNADGSRVRWAIPCAMGEAQFSGDARAERQVEKNEKRAATETADDAPDADAIEPAGIEALGPDADGIEQFRGSFNPAAGMGSHGVDVPGPTADLAALMVWRDDTNALANALNAQN